MRALYVRLSSLFPERVVNATRDMMTQGGFDRISARMYLGFVVFLSASLSTLSYFLTTFVTNNTFWHAVAPIFVFVLCGITFYFILALQANVRAQEVEAVLSSALQMMSSNLRAGMTMENALWNSARPEFGALGQEIKRLSAHVFGGQPVQKALTGMTERVRSPLVQRAVKLVNEGIALGGQMAPLLDSVASDIRSQQLLRKEIATSTIAYSLFIAFAAIIAAPVLFAVTTYYSQINENVLAKQQRVELPPTAQQSGLAGIATLFTGKGAQGISSEDIRWFSLAALSVTALFAALIIGLIHEGSALAGILWAPVFWIVCTGVYWFSLSALNASLGVLVR